jgi:nucleoside-diphosphate-sugar epimerase
VLVTGAAGFIGSHLCQSLVQIGADVVGLDDLSHGSWDNLEDVGPQVDQHTVSILDAAAVSDAVRGCRYVFHQAALGSVPRSIDEPELYHQVNVTGTLNVLQAAHRAGVKRVVFAASSSAYGDPPVDGPKVESMPPLPRSPYAATKLAGEHMMRAWAHSFGLDTVSLRYFNIFGPRQSPASTYAAVIAAFAKALHEGRGGTIFGDGSQSRDFTHVANVVHANLLAATAQGDLMGEVFNVGCGGRIDLNRLHGAMARLWGRADLAPTYAPVRAGDILHSQADIASIGGRLGYEPIVGFEEGLADAVAWYRRRL